MGRKSKKAVETGFITEVDRYLFGNGTHYEIYDKLGAHPWTFGGKSGYYFAVWAPHAQSVSLVGDFNNWNPDSHPMKLLEDSGIYELFVPDMGKGQLYKYAITTQSGQLIFKADPYAFSAEFRPGTASITSDIAGFSWKDGKWMAARPEKAMEKEPVSIYEVHLGSWRKKDRQIKEGFYTYKEAAHELADYVKSMGYTHVELMGIAEYPYDGSWGYQVTGYFAPTSRYGSPGDFMYFVDYLHRKGIGVILDWVPAHFPKDAHGLADFDGQPLYEYADPRKGEHPDWGTKVFDYNKNEVKNFLISNALYWVERYHVDGLRVDAVASMLYLDYGRSGGNWVPNIYGGNQNLEAIEFFKHLNSILTKRNKGAMVIAEESTAWPKVTHAPENDGLGFSFKWNMGWMHDFLEYMKLDPYFRKYNHNKMTFGMTYATSENFILVLSHDEVVHLKCSMINKMPGVYEDKFANLKVGYTFMMGHPGKKLLFMGQDFGQWHEWDEKVALDWHLTNEDLHKNLQNYVRDLLHLYKKYPALYQLDYDWNGFQWINANDSDRSIFSFVRRDETGKKNLLFICNFTPVSRPDYKVGVWKRGNYTLVLDNVQGMYQKSDNPPVLKAKKGECDGQPYHISFSLPAYGTAIFKF
ncbi:1,4-alpha-glucan branching protein GlgB [Lachnoclostridium edouardi]|uniref:1,4-alpha-glucan branching protein GlgB n=1 Tax=Lachnoclostridium edouardi TaxID=1926283 RepID=UPI000C7BED51|nr:1,4-alpha-glucan branching protein GlgB [Lachnoclostridium edouardi]